MGKNTIILMLQSGGDFSFFDMDLIAFHLKKQYGSDLRIVGFSNKATEEYILPHLELNPMPYKDWKGWWCKMNLFSPQLEQYRPFLFMDLDTAIVGDFSSLFPPKDKEDNIIMLEDLYCPGRVSGGLIYIPKKNKHIDTIWKEWIDNPKRVMSAYRGEQEFIRKLKFIAPINSYFQEYTDIISSFKPLSRVIGKPPTFSQLTTLPENKSVICFHGKPRIPKAGYVDWVAKYLSKDDN